MNDKDKVTALLRSYVDGPFGYGASSSATVHDVDVLVTEICTLIADARDEQRGADANLIDHCTCGSGPEFRALHMRHHVATCHIHMAALIRAKVTTDD